MLETEHPKPVVPQETEDRWRQRLLWTLAVLAVVIALYIVERYSYLLFHSLVELLTISIAFTIGILVWNSRGILKNDYLKVLGIGYTACACIDLVHTLAYRGMNVFPGVYDSNLPTQLWVAARYLQAFTLIAAPLAHRRNPDIAAIIIIYAFAVVALTGTVFNGVFPECYREGVGLTPFKIISEYIIVVLIAFSILLLRRIRSDFTVGTYRMIIYSSIFAACAEVAFTTYVSLYSYANMTGHFFKLLSFYLIYRAVFVTGIRDPFSIIFRELKEKENYLIITGNSVEQQVHERTAELERTSRRLENEQMKIRKRVREQQCIYDVFELTEDTTEPFDIQLKQIIERIPLCWLYPEITSARIEYDGIMIATPGFEETPWMQIAEAMTSEGVPIRLTVAYREDRLAEDEGPFLKEERTLINAIVHRLADMAGRRDARETLAFKTTLLEARSETSPDGILVVDGQGKAILYNKQFRELCGIPRDILESKDDKKMLDYVINQLRDPNEFISRVKYLYEHAEEKSIDEIALLDGRYFERHSLPLVSDVGKYLGRIWFFRDITERKRLLDELEAHKDNLEYLVKVRTEELDRALEMLKTSEKRYSDAMDASRDGLWDWNIKTNVTYLNSAYFRMLGYEPGELVCEMKECFTELLHPEDKERVLAEVKQHTENEGSYEIEFRMQCKDGQYKWIMSRGKVVEYDGNGMPARAVGTHTDLSTRKQLEIELRNTSDELRAIIETATIGIAMIRDRVIIRCNKKLEEIFGYGPGEMTGRTTRLWYEDDKTFAEIGREVADQLAKKGIFNKEHFLLSKDKTKFWARMTAKAIDRNDLSQGLVGIVEDITSEREFMDALRLAKERAEDADRLKSAFLATMSHELRTPLNSIIGFTGIVLQGLSGPVSEEQKKQLTMVKNSANHLLSLISDVLDISKIEAGQMSVDNEPFDMSASIIKIVQSIRPLAEKKGLNLTVEIGGDVDSILGDVRRVEQVLLNLLSNAVKFTEQGGIRVTCRAEGGKYITLVTDTGIGIRPEELEKLFKPFSQVDTGLSRKYEGTGLGLSICKRLIEMMGGSIMAESEPGRGSTFGFILPKERRKI